MKFDKAKWIWWTKEARPNEYGEFYTDFSFTGEKTTLLISADSNYAVYLNGELAAFGQYADYPYDKVYDIIDITDQCKKGKNHLAIIVWYYGIDTTQVYYPGNASLLFEVFSDKVSVAHSSDATLARQSRTYQNHTAKEITGQIGFSFHYDTTKEDHWMMGDLDGFAPCVTVTQAPPLRPRPCKRLLLEKRTDGKLIKELSPTELLFDLGVNTVGFLDIEIDSTKPQTLLISYGEHIADGCVRRLIGPRDFSVEVSVGKGTYHYVNPFRRLGAKYLQIKSDEPIVIKHIGLLPTTYPVTARPRPKLTDIESQIYDICERTLLLCMHEHYEDCPWREQALYTMDSRNQMLCGYYAFGEYRFPRASLELIAKDDRADGLLSICYPIKKDQVIPSFSLHYFTQCAEYLAHTGDKEFLQQIYPKLTSVLQVFLERGAADGNVIRPYAGKSYWNFYEWNRPLRGHIGESDEEKEPDIILNTLLSIALENMAIISDELGISHDYRRIKSKLNAAIHAHFYCPEKRLFRDRREEVTYSVLGNALAILAGVATEQEAGEICQAMIGDTTLVPVTLSMHCFFYDALLKTDKERYRDFILSDIEAIYRPMIEYGTGTVWETVQGECDFHNAGSLCHGWSALPIYYYHILKE